jgi:hypothetical protein
LLAVLRDLTLEDVDCGTIRTELAIVEECCSEALKAELTLGSAAADVDGGTGVLVGVGGTSARRHTLANKLSA